MTNYLTLLLSFEKKSSRMSLIAGASSGAFFLFAATDLKAYLFACKILSSILCIVMTNRARNSVRVSLFSFDI